MSNVHHLHYIPINCNVRVSDVVRGMKVDECDEVPSDSPLGLEGEYTFEYDYPLTQTARVKREIKPEISGFDLLLLGRSDYERIYQEEDDAVGPTPMIPGMFNRQRSSGPHGIWGHVIDDLFFEMIQIDTRNKIISFGMGS